MSVRGDVYGAGAYLMSSSSSIVITGGGGGRRSVSVKSAFQAASSAIFSQFMSSVAVGVVTCGDGRWREREIPGISAGNKGYGAIGVVSSPSPAVIGSSGQSNGILFRFMNTNEGDIP
jgi:hypothetical protein